MMRSLAILCVALSLSPPSVWAQTPAVPPPPTFSLTVTGVDDAVTHAGARRIVDRDDIEALHARTVDEALELTPGVRVRGGGNGRPFIDMHGLRSRHVLLLLDGVPLNSTHDGQFDAGLVPTDFLSSITLSFGASSVLYGEGAMGGVIELESETPPQGFELGGTVDVRQGTQALASLRAAAASRRTSLLVTGSGFNQNGFRLPSGFQGTGIEDGHRRANSDSERQSVFSRFAYAPGDSWHLATVISASAGAFGVPPGVVDEPADLFAQRVRYERTEAFQTQTTQFSWGYRPGYRFSARGWVFVNSEEQDRARYDDNTYSSMADESVAGTFEVSEQSSARGAAAQARYDLQGAGRLAFAVNGRRERFESAGRIRDVETGAGGAGGASGGGGGRGLAGPGTGTRRFSLRAFDDTNHVDTYSAGIEWSRPLTQAGGLVAGISESWQERVAHARVLGTAAMGGVFRDIGPSTTVRGSVFRRVRFPSLRQLYEPGSGDGNLAPEWSHGLEAGVVHRWNRLRAIEVDAFWTDTRHFIERSDDSLRYVNRDRHRLRGVDVSWRPNVGTSHSLRIAHSFLSAVDRSLARERSELQYQPRHRILVDGRWNMSHGIALRTALSIVGAQHYYSRVPPVVRKTAHPYALSGMSLSKTVGGGRHTVTVGVDNAFDVVYESPYAMPQEGRTVYLRVRARL